ncbi:oligosaccharide flippase family protein [Aureimonas flava]|uniref:oligosaccharide flippase family protein n=1 Tax=Aureimonas flava TaxID=2320271 RepID=UPI001459FF97|nr:oligosaccharide flippase family protein [Aureimonas flava]
MTSVRTSLIWSAARNWGTRLGSVVVFIVVARVLPPSQLGLFATAATVIAVAELVAENGLGEAVVQAPELDERMLSAALIVNVLLGAAVAGVLLLAGPWLEAALDASGLGAILSVVVLVILLNAFSYVPQAYLRRRFEFRWLAFRALVATGVSGAVGIAMALSGFGVWSLVAQALLAALLNLVLIWRAKPWRPRLVAPTAAAPLFKVSGHIFGSKLVDFVANRGIELAIAAGAGPAALALWVMASRPWAVLMQLISAVTMDVALPSFARLASERDALLRAYYVSIQTTVAIGTPVFVLLAMVAPEVMAVLFGDNGRDGGFVLTLLSLLGAMQLLQYYNGTLLNALGLSHKSFRISLVKAAAISVALFVTFGQSLWNVALGFTVAQVLVTPLSFAIASRAVNYSISHLLRLIAPFLLAEAVACAAILLAREWGPHIDSALLRGLSLGVLGGVTYLAAAFLFNRHALMRIVSSIVSR